MLKTNLNKYKVILIIFLFYCPFQLLAEVLSSNGFSGIGLIPNARVISTGNSVIAFDPTTNAFAIIKQPVTLRTIPTLSFASGATYFRFQLGTGDFDVTTLSGTYYATTDTALVLMSSTGMTAGNGGMAAFNNASAYIEMSSEL